MGVSARDAGARDGRLTINTPVFNLDDIGRDHVGHTSDATSSHAADGTSGDELAHIGRECAPDCTDEEQCLGE